VTRWDYYYFRTKNGAEIDLILEGSFGVLPSEIKVGQKTTLRDLTFLQRFITKENLPFGVVVNNSQEVRMLSEKIIQIPAGCL
jgi:predicted AAA+ superfamily ATPase